MSERGPLVDDQTLKFGLLMESAQTHQHLAEAHLQRLHTHTQDLDGVVRDEIRRTLVEELHSLSIETERAARALRGLKRSVSLRAVVWNLSVGLVCCAPPLLVARWVLPSPAAIAALRVKQEALTANVERLERRGGRVDWRLCGDKAQICVRVDRKGTAYGPAGEYAVVLEP